MTFKSSTRNTAADDVATRAIRSRIKPSPVVVAAVVALLAGGGGFAVAATSTGVIDACKNTTSGALRIAAPCKSTETAVSWNQVGPQGVAGATGAKGAAGPRGLPGAPGSARAYGTLVDFEGGPVRNSKGLTVRHKTGYYDYCVVVDPSIDLSTATITLTPLDDTRDSRTSMKGMLAKAQIVPVDDACWLSNETNLQIRTYEIGISVANTLYEQPTAQPFTLVIQ